MAETGNSKLFPILIITAFPLGRHHVAITCYTLFSALRCTEGI